jgi:phosphopantothenoylcysteine decarboxylase/phosphopantothenate--cysteine ligase
VDSDALIMAAAVADFRPTNYAGRKLKRRLGQIEIHLEATPDILEEVARLRSNTGCPHVVVGFAAESHDLIDSAREKLHKKGLDLIVANDITTAGAGFNFDTNQVTILNAGGGEERLPLMSKSGVADLIMDRISNLLDVSR